MSSRPHFEQTFFWIPSIMNVDFLVIGATAAPNGTQGGDIEPPPSALRIALYEFCEDLYA